MLAGLHDSNWHLTLIGDGLLMDATRRQVDHHGLTPRVEFTGWLKATVVHWHLSGADLLLMPSSFEGLPMAAIEALKHGMAIAASDIPGIRDVVHSGLNGLRLPIGDKEAWISALRSLLADEAQLLSMKQSSRENAAYFDLQRIATEYETVLETAAASRRPKAR